ncbi:hypothetical protein BJY00DRAFT_273455 [Aspergillus carlsbadensis]|nr:hypothetical protein BJY00DRAFT_273455 [Aspergillus carlsbadensis]
MGAYHGTLHDLFQKFNLSRNPSDLELDALPHTDLVAFHDLLLAINHAGSNARSEYNIAQATVDEIKLLAARLESRLHP